MSVARRAQGEVLSLTRRSFLRASTLAGASLAGASTLARPALAAGAPDIVITRQPGLILLPSLVMERMHLVEKHAERMGLSGLKVRWKTVPIAQDHLAALNTGEVQIANSGLARLLDMWARSEGAVRGIVATGAQPFFLVSADPDVQSLRDIKPEHRIAVPVRQISTQAIALQMAAAQLYGEEAWRRFDDNCIAMPHAAAVVLMRSRESPIKLHFAAPPFHYHVLRTIRSARVIATSWDIVGGPHTNGQFLTTTRFAQAQPVVIEALRAAAAEARIFIEKRTRDAVDLYREFSSDKTDAADLLDVLSQPDMMSWQLYPQGTFALAQHLHRVGFIQRTPGSWRDYYFPLAHDLPGS